MTIKDEICPTVKVDARLLDDGTLWIKTDKIADIGRVIVEDGKTSCKQFYQDAQHEPCEDAVSRKAVQYLLAHFVDGDKYVDACDGLKHLPPAQPEIIRCKDCKHWIPYDWMFSEVWQSKNIADYPEDEIGCDCCDMAMKANDFCSRGERRTE